jgi:hypothetical protein
MILSKYYRDYKGPDLVVAELWLNEDDKETFIDYMKVFYGENNNWNGKLYTYGEIFPQRENNGLFDSVADSGRLYPAGNHKFYLEFLGKDGRVHWFSGMVGSKEQIFNPPLARCCGSVPFRRP